MSELSVFNRTELRNTGRIILASGALLLSACGGESNSSDSTSEKQPSAASKDHASETIVPLSDCEWSNNQPRGIIKAEVPLVTVDGTCNPPRDAPVGIYSEPSQESKLVAKRLNDEYLVVECVEPKGQEIRDVRGDVSASETWIKVSEVDGEQFTGYVPEVNVGYVEDHILPQC